MVCSARRQHGLVGGERHAPIQAVTELAFAPSRDIIFPMRTLVPVAFATILSFGLMVAQAPPQGKGGPKAPPKNLKILPADANLIPTMQSFVAGLGLADKGGCGFCHVQDRSSDEKMEKVMARMMIGMVKDINTKEFTDGKEHVTCYTCHRGDTEPKTAP
jgi:hypothetical protein